jgi:hypothetical protein
MRYLYLILACILCSCGRTENFRTEAELIAYIRDEDNGLIKSAELNNYKIEVMYKPVDLLVNQEIGEEPVDEQKLNGLKLKYQAYYYFTLSLSRNNKEALHQVDGGMEQYSALVQTLSFRMNEYVTMTTSAYDTIPAGDFILNRTYGMSTSTDLLFVFNKEKSADKEWVQFNLNEFGLGIGNQRFRFKRKDLDDAPGMNFVITPNV